MILQVLNYISQSPEAGPLNPLWVLIIANVLLIGGIFAFAQSNTAAKSDNTIVLNSHQYASATSGTPQVAGDSISKDMVAIDKCKTNMVNGTPKINCPTAIPTPQVAGDQIEAATIAPAPQPKPDSRPALLRFWSDFSIWASFIGR